MNMDHSSRESMLLEKEVKLLMKGTSNNRCSFPFFSSIAVDLVMDSICKILRIRINQI